MSHYLTNDDKYRDLLYGDDYRGYLVARCKSAAGDKLGRMQGNRFRVCARNALGRVHGYLKSMIEAIADAKLRRMERKLELRGIRFDRSNNNWVARKSQPTEH